MTQHSMHYERHVAAPCTKQQLGSGTPAKPTLDTGDTGRGQVSRAYGPTSRASSPRKVVSIRLWIHESACPVATTRLALHRSRSAKIKMGRLRFIAWHYGSPPPLCGPYAAFLRQPKGYIKKKNGQRASNTHPPFPVMWKPLQDPLHGIPTNRALTFAQSEYSTPRTHRSRSRSDSS